MAAADGVGRHYHATCEFNNRISGYELILTEGDEETQSTYTFLHKIWEGIQQNAEIKVQDSQRPLKDMVTEVVTEYEAGRGLFARIWDCIMSILCCCSPSESDEIAEFAQGIEQVEILGNRFVSGYFRKQLKDVFDFLANLPRVVENDFEDQRRSEITQGSAGVPRQAFSYYFPLEGESPICIDELTAEECIHIAKELYWFFDLYAGEFKKENDIFNFNSMLASPLKINVAAFHGIEDSQVNTVFGHFNRIFLAAAAVAFSENNLIEAVEAVSRVDSVFGNEDGKQLILRICDQCLEQGKFLDAQRVISRVYIENKWQISAKIVREALRIEPLKEENVQVALSVALNIRYEDKALQTLVVERCVQAEKTFYPYALAATKELQFEENGNQIIEKVVDVFLKVKDYENAKQAIEAMSFDALQAMNWHKIASAYFEAGDYDNAVSCAQKMFFLKDKRSDLLKNIASVYFKASNLPKAAGALSKAWINEVEDFQKRQEIQQVICDVFWGCIAKKDYENALIAITPFSNKDLTFKNIDDKLLDIVKECVRAKQYELATEASIRIFFEENKTQAQQILGAIAE
jgi:hypothetical protein